MIHPGQVIGNWRQFVMVSGTVGKIERTMRCRLKMELDWLKKRLGPSH
jgi:hypothetical protein